MAGPNFHSACIGADGQVTGDDTSILPWWSFTKTVLATAALLLVEQGKLGLDTVLTPRPYTLRQLLRHQSGLPDYGGATGYQAAARRGDPPWSVTELLERANAKNLIFQPGQGWGYSNIGYLFVRQLIEQCTGQDIGAALESLIFSRHQLKSVRLAGTAEDLATTAWGNAANYHPGWVYHGLLTGSPADAARFLHLLMTGKILPAGLLTQMLDRHPIGGPVAGRPWLDTGYGMGLMLGSAPAGPTFGHSGAGPGSSAAIYHLANPVPQTAAVFAPVEDQGPVEFEATRLR